MTAPQVGIGITIPIRRGKNGYFAQSYTLLDAVKTNLVNLLLTAKGERPFQPTFGCDLHTLVFSQMGPDFEAEVENAITSAVNQWMPFLSIVSTNIVRDDDHNLTTVQVQFQLKTNVGVTDEVTITF